MTDRELAGCALSEVMALLEKATPGEWSHAAEYGWNIATDNYDPMSRVGASVGMALWPKDAYAICAAVNFLRQHGPALLAALSTPSSEGDGRDAERLLYLVKDGGVEGFRHVKADIYDYACDAAEESGRDEPNDADMLSGMRRLIDAAIAAAAGGS